MGPSSLDWAITEAAPCWGVTALQGVEEMDTGDIWAFRTFPLPAEPPAKSALYNSVVADAAVRTVLRGLPVHAYDAHAGQPPAGEPGTVAATRHGAVLVRAGSGGVWLGHLRAVPSGDASTIKLPATTVLADRLAGVPKWTPAVDAGTDCPYREISYRREGRVGLLDVDVYNGAMSTAQCRRLEAALRHAAEQDTRVLVIRGGRSAGVFSNGIHLNVIDAAPNPALEGWRNIVAIDDVCRQLLTATRQIVIAAVAGNAGGLPRRGARRNEPRPVRGPERVRCRPPRLRDQTEPELHPAPHRQAPGARADRRTRGPGSLTRDHGIRRGRP